uniref:palmitoyl-protein hydrolase n=1 Tax=Phlebotomus kandelakii TaxID=1109342 RepID=A0A6B2E4M1_9DIPT
MSVAPVIIEATAKHTATLIFLHGLGDTGHGWATAMAGIRTPNMKVICPTAPTIPVTLNAGFRMPSWFDLKTLDVSGPQDEAGILAATVNVHKLINDEIREGIVASRIMIGGFSQGGALALYAALTFPEALAGVLALSSWLPLHKAFPAGRKCPDSVPIFQGHGDCDPVVPYKYGQLTSAVLKTFMTRTSFTTYRGMTHSSSDEELEDLKKFVLEHVPRQ